VEKRVAALVPQVEATAVAALAIEARERLHLRHMSLLLVREMVRHASHRPLVAVTLVRVIQRADELANFVAICWKDGKQPLSAQVKKGLAAACVKFGGYQLAKYDRAVSGRASARRALSLPRAPSGCDAGGAVKQLAEGTPPAQERQPPGRPERKSSARSQGPNPIIPTDEHSGGVNL
jgi:hypothetical protein